jgi:HEAT repeat protein
VIRAATARVLGRLRVADAGEVLIASLNDSSALVRRYAAEALGRIREERAVQALIDLTAYYGENELAAETLLALARIAHPSALELFRQRLSSSSAPSRRAAAEGLGRLGDRESLPALQSMAASDRSAGVRLAASFAVGRLADPQAHVIAGALASPETRQQAYEYLVEIGAPAIAGIRSALSVATAHRAVADLLHVLGFIGTDDALALLRSYGQDPNEDVRRAASNAIARIG